MEVVVRTRGGEAEVTVEIGDPPDAALADLAGAIGAGTPTTVAVDGRLIASATTLATAGLQRGGVVDLAPISPGTGDSIGAPAVEVVTIAGVGVGRRRQLAPGIYHVGPGSGGQQMADGTVHDVRWRLRVPEADEVTAVRIVELDDRVVELRPLGAVSNGRDRRKVLPSGAGADGTVAFNRPPRTFAAGADDPIVVPERTRQREERRSIPVVAMIAPLPIAVAMALMLGSWRYALFGLLSPIMGVANVIEDRRERRRDGDRATRADRAVVRAVGLEIADRHRAAIDRARQGQPHLAELLVWMHDSHPRLWERRPPHDDAFVVPIGWGDEPWQPSLERRLESVCVQRAIDAHAHLPSVPITLDLRDGTGLGLVGTPRDGRSVARAVVLAAVALQGPADLTVVVCVDHNTADWEWVKWLPHAAGQRVRLFVDPTAGVDLPDPGTAERGHVVIVIADGERWWHGRAAPLRAALNRSDVRLIALTEHARFVPATCTTVVRVPGRGRADLHHVPSGTTTAAVALNQVELDVAVDAARRLARLDDPEVTSVPAGRVGDGLVRLVEELALQPPTVDGIRRRWADPDRRAATPLGTNRAGPVIVDLVADGPHALVAGTTGSGKSELLRTLVAGLAVTLPPTELNVVLIDFKGGAAFDACARLPHTVGLVTDLDEHLAARMLRSLRAEVTHRERQLRDAGAASLDDLNGGRSLHALARLLIVVDEFAALATQLPNFVPGLIDVAQRGRSLGVHLVLATQRPAGVVDNKIRANTNLRIALRVHDDSDSFDVIGTRDAVAIPRHQPGRAVARFGAGELVELQTALVTAVSRPCATSFSARPFVIARPLSPAERRLVPTPPPAGIRGPNDLDRLVDVVRAAAGPVTVRPPCRDPLPSMIHAHDVPDHAVAEGPGIPLAIVDRPDEQRWSLRTWQPGPARSLGLIGMTGTGTTSTLTVLALGLATTNSPDDCHLYVIDADAMRLAALDPLPHVGAVVGLDQPDRIARLARNLGLEIDRRRGGVAAGRAAPDEPSIVVLIDNVASLQHALDRDRQWREVWPMIERLFRDGGSVGVTMVVTTTHERGLPMSIAAHLGERLLLRLSDRSAYAAFGLRPAEVPDLRPGRAIDPATGLELQLLAPPIDIGAAVAAVSDHWVEPVRPPRSVPTLPTTLVAADVIDAATASDDGWSLPIGLGERDGDVVALPLRRGQTLAVYGPRGSGRTSTLRTLLRALHTIDPTVARFALGPGSGLSDLATGPTNPRDVGRWIDAVLRAPGLRVIVVDDADEIGGPSLERLAACRDPDLAIVIAGAIDRLRNPSHWARPLLRTRSGVLLAAAPGDGDVLRISVPITPGCVHAGPGHGQAVIDGLLIPVLLADGTGTTVRVGAGIGGGEEA